MLYLLLNVEPDPHYEPLGRQLLRHLCDRLSLAPSHYHVTYCYKEDPPTRQDQRAPLRDHRRAQLERLWDTCPGVGDTGLAIVGMGKYACEMLFGKGIPKNRVGTRWKMSQTQSDILAGRVPRIAWYTYDPSAALYDPNLCVDISAVLYNAAKESGIAIHPDPSIKTFKWNKLL